MNMKLLLQFYLQLNMRIHFVTLLQYTKNIEIKWQNVGYIHYIYNIPQYLQITDGAERSELILVKAPKQCHTHAAA